MLLLQVTGNFNLKVVVGRVRNWAMPAQDSGGRGGARFSERRYRER
jgi:hypothetical protein